MSLERILGGKKEFVGVQTHQKENFSWDLKDTFLIVKRKKKKIHFLSNLIFFKNKTNCTYWCCHFLTTKQSSKVLFGDHMIFKN